MPITITSTTDTQEQINEALGGKVEEKKEAVESQDTSEAAPVEETDESQEPQDSDPEEKSEEVSGEESDDEESSIEEKPKKKSGFKRRIEKLSSRLAQREQELELLKQRYLDQSQPKPQEEVAKKVSEGKPNQNDFESYEDYVDALTEWKVEKKLSEEKAKAKEIEAKTLQEKKFQAHAERVKEFAKTRDDFDEVMEDLGDTRVSLAVEEIILESSVGPAIIYELAKNKEELERINSLSPLSAARELGKLEAKLQSIDASDDEPKKPLIKTTKAPAPLKTLGKSSKSVVKDPDEMNFQEFKKWRLANS